MATSFQTPNMNLTVPITGEETGPNWANDINASLTVIDSHNHGAGSGVQITPDGIDISSDLSFQANNAVDFRSVRFDPQAAPLSGMFDLGCLYESLVDLYYNDGNGNQIRITQSGSVAGAAGTITGLPSGTASAAYESASGTFQFQQSTSTGANLDVASIIVRYPGSYPTPSGNGIILEAPSSLASLYSLTLPALPSQTNVLTIDTSGVMSNTSYDQIGVNMTSTGANAIANTRTRTTNASTVGVGGVAISGGSGNFTTSSGTYTAITNQAVTIVLAGRPVMVMLTGAANPNASNPGAGAQVVNASGSTQIFGIGLFRGSTIVAQFTWQNLVTSVGVGLSLMFVDTPGSGTWTYTWQAITISGGSPMGVFGVQTCAYEL